MQIHGYISSSMFTLSLKLIAVPQLRGFLKGFQFATGTWAVKYNCLVIIPEWVQNVLLKSKSPNWSSLSASKAFSITNGASHSIGASSPHLVSPLTVALAGCICLEIPSQSLRGRCNQKQLARGQLGTERRDCCLQSQNYVWFFSKANPVYQKKFHSFCFLKFVSIHKLWI